MHFLFERILTPDWKLKQLVGGSKLNDIGPCQQSFWSTSVFSIIFLYEDCAFAKNTSL